MIHRWGKVLLRANRRDRKGRAEEGKKEEGGVIVYTSFGSDIVVGIGVLNDVFVS